ncbi:plasmid mobilization protein [Armatimonas sp.]|uniref:plasmid mobilization protein n=1 Tax=Armatimonas sp. TaxID=1872638 RepID=UPI003752DE21
MTEAPQFPKVQKSPKSHHKGPQKIYPRVVYARVTEQEWSTIQLRADQSGLSMSRYLVETGLRGKPPPTKADRARLQFLLYQFRRAAVAINQVATDRLVMAVGGSETRQLLRETASLLEQLAQELTRRISTASSEEKMEPPPDPEREP